MERPELRAVEPLARQPVPKTPVERREQAEARKDWLDGWIDQYVFGDGTQKRRALPTLIQARDALRKRFGRTLSNEYLCIVLARKRASLALEVGEGPAVTMTVPQEKIDAIARAMNDAGLSFVRLNGKGRPAELGFKIRP